MNINLHIERLILDGLPVERGQGAMIQQAVERELAALLAAGELHSTWQSGGNVPRLQTAPIQLRQETKPGRLGEQIAGAVHGELGK